MKDVVEDDCILRPMRCFRGQVAGLVRDDAGAVTVDWTVLAAAIVVLSVATVGTVQGGITSMGSNISAALAGASVGPTEDGSDSTWAPGQWEQHNPGIYDSYVAWMQDFSDPQIMAHMSNMEQYADAPPGSGHPIDTYHDEYWIARDIAIERGLVDP